HGPLYASWPAGHCAHTSEGHTHCSPTMPDLARTSRSAAVYARGSRGFALSEHSTASVCSRPAYGPGAGADRVDGLRVAEAARRPVAEAVQSCWSCSAASFHSLTWARGTLMAAQRSSQARVSGGVPTVTGCACRRVSSAANLARVAAG